MANSFAVDSTIPGLSKDARFVLEARLTQLFELIDQGDLKTFRKLLTKSPYHAINAGALVRVIPGGEVQNLYQAAKTKPGFAGAIDKVENQIDWYRKLRKRQRRADDPHPYNKALHVSY